MWTFKLRRYATALSAVCVLEYVEKGEFIFRLFFHLPLHKRYYYQLINL